MEPLRHVGIWCGAALIAGGLVGACSAADPFTPREYRRAANEICRRSTLAVAALKTADAAKPNAMIAVGRTAVGMRRTSLRRLAELDAPAAVEVRVGRWLDLVGRTLERTMRSLEAQQQQDLDAAARANAEGGELSTQADVIARGLGLNDCATPTTE